MVVLGGNDAVALARVCDALERSGFHVVAKVQTARQAVEASLRHRPDVCLLETDMVGDSLQASAQIRSRLRETRVAMLAASAPEEEVIRAVQAGADGYLLKSTPVERLPAAVRAVSSGEPALPRVLMTHLVQLLRESAEHPHHPHGRINRTLLYLPRFVRHFRRRLRSEMSVSAAWDSARTRMRRYGDG